MANNDHFFGLIDKCSTKQWLFFFNLIIFTGIFSTMVFLFNGYIDKHEHDCFWFNGQMTKQCFLVCWMDIWPKTVLLLINLLAIFHFSVAGLRMFLCLLNGHKTKKWSFASVVYIVAIWPNEWLLPLSVEMAFVQHLIILIVRWIAICKK